MNSKNLFFLTAQIWFAAGVAAPMKLDAAFCLVVGLVSLAFMKILGDK